MNQEQERQKVKDCADEKSSKAKFLVIEVDDFSKWLKFVINQGYAEDDKYVLKRYEYGGNKKWVYRGQMDAEFPISSSFERVMSADCRSIKFLERSLRSKERDSIFEFKKRAWQYVPNPKMNLLEWLTVMRHYGVPTRLVDFSESAMVALYFALEKDAKTDFAIWAVNREALRDCFQNSLIGREFPGMKNGMAKYGKSFQTMLNDPNCTDADVVKAQESITKVQRSLATSVLADEENRNVALRILETPLDRQIDEKVIVPALYFCPEMPSKRMLAQRGLFLMSTKISVPFMNALYKGMDIDISGEPQTIKMSEVGKSTDNSDATLIKFVFKRSLAKEARELLRLSDYGCDRMYPDIEGVAGSVGSRVRKSLSGYFDADKLIVKGQTGAALVNKIEDIRDEMLRLWS